MPAPHRFAITSAPAGLLLALLVAAPLTAAELPLHLVQRTHFADVRPELAALQVALNEELSRRDLVIQGSLVVEGRVFIRRHLEFAENSELVFAGQEGEERAPYFVFADTIVLRNGWSPGTIRVASDDAVTPESLGDAANGRWGYEPGEDGGPGADGENGQDGFEGLDGPRIYLVARVIKTPGLRIDVRGFPGTAGGQGQNGGDGGRGMSGRDGSQSAFQCKRRPQDGGDGGDAGDGGNGGKGGKGGNGGVLTVIVPSAIQVLEAQQQRNSPNAPNSPGVLRQIKQMKQPVIEPPPPLNVTTDPGAGGASGGAGQAGSPGEGASGGSPQAPFCPGSGKFGTPGKSGKSGIGGASGAAGEKPAMIRIVQISPEVFDAQFGADTSNVWWWPF